MHSAKIVKNIVDSSPNVAIRFVRTFIRDKIGSKSNIS